MRDMHGVRGSVAGLLALVVAGCTAAPAQTPGDAGFDLDPEWPQPFEQNWIYGSVTGIAVDGRGHIWVTHAQDMATSAAHGAAADPPVSTCCLPAPVVVEYDPAGNVVQTWSGDGADYTWPDVPHGIYVDHNDFVWVASRPHHELLKFTRDGDLVLKIGEFDVTGGSNDPDRLGRPAGVWVDPESNEVFVADGYGNRRVVVYDGETGAYVRHWGAYGEVPDDDYAYGPRGADTPPAREFGTVHGISCTSWTGRTTRSGYFAGAISRWWERSAVEAIRSDSSSGRTTSRPTPRATSTPARRIRSGCSGSWPAGLIRADRARPPRSGGLRDLPRRGGAAARAPVAGPGRAPLSGPGSGLPAPVGFP